MQVCDIKCSHVVIRHMARVVHICVDIGLDIGLRLRFRVQRMRGQEAADFGAAGPGQ